jgi:pyruvate-formate lyase-activating enzyme
MTDRKGTKILARTFFTQLRAGGYTPNQILDIATELIDLMTTDLKESPSKSQAAVVEVQHNA